MIDNQGLPIFDTEENVSGDVGGSSTIGDGHIRSPTGDRVGEVMGKDSLGCSIGITTDIPDRQPLIIERSFKSFSECLRRRDKEM